MKLINIKILFIFFTATTLCSCNINMLFDSINGNRNVISEKRKASENFTKIMVSAGLDLYINQSDTPKIVVEADENLQEIIMTEVNDGVLKIYTEKNIWRAKSKKIYVNLQTLNAITATSGAEVYTNKTVNVDDIQLSTTSGASIKVALKAKTVESTATSGSDIEISGTTEQHNSKATSGASINAYKLKSETVNVKASSGADINIYASKALTAKASSGGDIDYDGTPKKITKKSSSGGSISAK